MGVKDYVGTFRLGHPRFSTELAPKLGNLGANVLFRSVISLFNSILRLLDVLRHKIRLNSRAEISDIEELGPKPLVSAHGM